MVKLAKMLFLTTPPPRKRRKERNKRKQKKKRKRKSVRKNVFKSSSLPYPTFLPRKEILSITFREVNPLLFANVITRWF